MGKRAVSELRGLVRAPIFTADDRGYDDARAVWNAMSDKRPLAIVRAEQVADVVGAVNFAREGAWNCQSVAAGTVRPVSARTTAGW
jgi:hypothetical protein